MKYRDQAACEWNKNTYLLERSRGAYDCCTDEAMPRRETHRGRKEEGRNIRIKAKNARTLYSIDF